MASAEINIRFSRELMKEVMPHCQLSGHSSRMFIEECVRALLEQINAEGTIIPLPALAVMVRKKLGRETRALDEAVRQMVQEELTPKSAPKRQSIK